MSRSSINAIFAIDKNGGMGLKNELPWPTFSSDLQKFKRHTQFDIVAMGRNTWESKKMPTPLPGRINVIFTSTKLSNPDIDNVLPNNWEYPTTVITVSGSPEIAFSALMSKFEHKDLWVIGGPKLLIQCEPLIQKVFLTRIDKEYESDTSIDIDKFLHNFVLTSTSFYEPASVADSKKYGIIDEVWIRK